MKNKIINLTPHPVVILGDNGQTIATIPVSGLIARCNVKTETVGDLNGIPVTETVFESTGLLPEQMDGVFYVVSRITLLNYRDRKDLVTPNEVIRDRDGIIVGCKSLARN